MVQNCAADSSSLPLLQTGRDFAVTSMPVFNKAEYKGTINTRMPLMDCYPTCYGWLVLTQFLLSLLSNLLYDSLADKSEHFPWTTGRTLLTRALRIP